MDEDGAIVTSHTRPKKPEQKYRTQEDVAKEIQGWIQLNNEDIDLKLFPNAISHIESELGRQLSSLERTCLEWQYVKIVLEMWHKETLRKMFDDLENPATDISMELSTLLTELNFVNSFQEIDTKLKVRGSRLRIWCDGGCKYLQLIVKQEELFKDTHRFTILVPCFFNHFKIFCINELFSRCWNYVVNNKTNGEKYRNFLSALNNFLANVMECKDFQDFMEESVSENVLQDPPACIKMICEHFPTDCNEESVIQYFKLAAAKIADDDWTREFTSLVIEIFKKYLLPKIEVLVKNEDGREIISIQGNVVFLSKIMAKMIELKSNNVQEIQIVGLVSLHVDCDLENEIWHGINVGVITDKIIVDCEVSWNVSGQHMTHQKAEEPRQPGESGGNVHLVCNEVINANQWTIISDGGDGSAAHKWTRDEFRKAFPSMSLLGDTGDQNKEIIATKLQNLLPGERISGRLEQPNFTIEEFMEDVQQLLVSFYKTEKKRHTLIFFQGRGVGQGGYGGTVTLEILNRPPFVQPSLPFIGFQKRLPYATRVSDVYQTSGSDGKTGKPAGDIGFIHNVNSDNCATNKEGNYFGFENDARLELNFSQKPTEGENSCVKQVQNGGNPLKRYTSIEIKEGVAETKRLVEAVKKKAILRQNLYHHLSQINQRKEMFQTLQAILSSSLQSHPINRDEVLAKQVESINIRFRQQSFRSQQFQMDNKQAKMVKPAYQVQFKPDDLDSSPLLAYQQQVVTGREDVASTLNSPIDPSQTPEERNVDYIISDLMRELQISKGASEHIFLSRIKEIVQSSKKMDLNDAILSQRDLVQGRRAAARFDRIATLIKEMWSTNGLDLTSDGQLGNFLHVYNFAVQEQLGFPLRDTQRVAIMTLLRKHPNSRNALVQVSTGEGKSLIVAGVAIAFALSEKQKSKSFSQIDVITSNSVLALRDSTLSSDKGGLKDIYEFFNVSVANNCSHSIEERTKAYDSAVVYGELANFQRDYLLDKFYGSDSRGNRRFQHVIIDEVDCMLLDRGNNTLYLSHDIPGMETLESLYVFIWEKMCNSTNADNNSKKQLKELIKSGVLLDLYGVTTKNDLKLVHAPLDDSEKDALWNHLIDKKVIDQNGRLLIADVNQITEEKINYEPKKAKLKEINLNAKLVFYLRKLANRQRRIRIPAHLLGFVDRNLDTWIDNAFHALDLRRDENYVIDQDRTDTSPDLNPQVIIIDPDTGTDQTLSQWDGALHQFLQLKEGCKLTLQSLKAVFISNAAYIMKYDKRMLGVSGTLGSKQEQEFLRRNYRCTLIRVPTAFAKVFTLRPPKVFFSEAQWLQEIIQETLNVLNVPGDNRPFRELNDVDVKPRSIVIFCRTIREVNKLHQELKLLLPIGSLHRYTRDYEKFAFESGQLDIGHAILATNLAGRGTDIKISNDLRKNGGLHICLTYLPENERIKEQAMGRAARNGDPGSGILILCDSRSDHTSNKDEEFDAAELLNKMEAKRNELELQRLSRLKEDFEDNRRQEKLFETSIKTFSEEKVQAKLEESPRKWKKDYYQRRHVVMQAFRDSALDKWALFLDANSNCSLDFRMELPNPKNFDEMINWIMPVRLIAVAKQLAIQKKPNFSMVNQILEHIVHSGDSFFYPAFHYYQTFIFLKEKKFLKEKNEFFRKLRMAETVINDHIDMQLSFNSIMNKSMSNSVKIPSFCVVDAYKEQKENNVKILEFFLGSLRSLLGNYCSIADLREASKPSPKNPSFLEKTLSKIEKWFNNDNNKTRKGGPKIRMQYVDKYFKSLIESRCIACELNDPATIPKSSTKQEDVDNESCSNRSALIQLIANDYGVGVSLEKILKSIFDKALSEEEIEKEFKKENVIPFSRKMFWKKLVDTEVLEIPKVGVEMECVIMSDAQCNEIPKLDRNEAIALNFGIDTYDRELNRVNVLYNPIYDNEKQLKERNKILFSKTYVKRILSVTEYERGKQHFEFNKIARLDLNKLRTVDLREFGCLRQDDFYRANIIPTEREGLWNELLKQNVIDDQGSLLADYHVTKGFDYPQCPAYSEAVMHLIGQKFIVEIVRRQWLKIEDATSKSGPDYLKAINMLPLKPYRDMLGDLMAAHVISGARLTEEDGTKLQEEILKLKKADDQERKALLEFLENHQSIYSRRVTPEFFLDPLERTLRIGSCSSNIFNELIVFRLMELDSVIDVKDRKWTWKMICLTSLLASIIIAGGAASISAGAILTYSQILSFGFCKDLFFMGGFSDIAYAVTTILLRKDLTWADYGRQRIRSAMGKVDPIETIKTIYTLSSKQHVRPGIKTNSAHVWMQRDRQKGDESGIANTQCKSSTCTKTDDEDNQGQNDES
ncbi:hypothetical protein GHT06_010884 [Daphnia sinensis]|uniref:Helicase c-terminal domain containing protein n=1 Tax=Daphnia sinensis TaxID=1820382 RepID=A0AAD5KZ55_9CRUS|nr:hypothetical protein GHT06_010884 [Daphnia sinensis]